VGALSSEQQGVVDSNESLVVVAGPGSGKTRVLTEKARQLMNDGHSILCLCFTRSAAREMSERVPMLPATTIHSYCCGVVGWNDAWEYRGLLYRFMLTGDKDRYDWVLLDECQDVNELELDVVTSLVGGKLFAVGDPYQSIYGFQGAMGAKVMEYLAILGCGVEVLHDNYRSAPHVVKRLNEVYDRKLVSKGVKDTGLTAILCRRNDDVFYVSNELKGRSIPHRIRLSAEVSENRERDIVGESNLRLMTIHCAKGHEFDKVVLFDWYPDNDGEEKRVYYVAMSRASKHFVIANSIDELLFEL